jgi:hypothetical protein
LVPGMFTLRPCWYAPPEVARHALAALAATRPVIASSVGYSVGDGDYEGATVLRDVPHAVVAVSDFRSLWMRLAWLSEGLAGDRDIEWQAMPSSTGKPDFGYLVLKPRGRAHPAIVVPCLVRYRERIVSVATALPSPHGVRLLPSGEAPARWLGPALYRAVTTAAVVFEQGLELPLGRAPGT